MLVSKRVQQRRNAARSSLLKRREHERARIGSAIPASTSNRAMEREESPADTIEKLQSAIPIQDDVHGMDTEHRPPPKQKQLQDNYSASSFLNTKSSDIAPRLQSSYLASSAHDTNSEATGSAATSEQPPAKRRPGRPRKNTLPVVIPAVPGKHNNSITPTGSAVASEPVKRGLEGHEKIRSHSIAQLFQSLHWRTWHNVWMISDQNTLLMAR